MPEYSVLLNKDGPKEKTRGIFHFTRGTDEGKVVEKIQHPFIINTLTELGAEGNFLNLINNIYKKPTTYITLNDEKLEASLLSSGTRMSPSPLLFIIVLGVPADVIRKGNQRYTDWEKINKTVIVHK